jgi:iron complex outermembrane recepter protein
MTVHAHTHRMRRTGAALLAWAISACAAMAQPAAPAPAASQPAVSELAPVRVIGNRTGYKPTDASTGTKTDTALKDVPQTVNVVPLEELRDRGVVKLTDVFNTVAGTQAGTGYGGLGNGYGTYIRGFSSGTNYRDGFRDFSFISPRDIALFERVEILKGPSSVLYGTNDPGGIVNYVAKRPQFESQREVSLAIGSYDARRGEIDLTGPIDSEGTLAYRLIVVGDDRDSHRDFVSSKTRVLAPSVTWKLSTQTSLTVSAEAIRYDYTFERGFPVAPEFLSLPRERFLEEPGLNFARTDSTRLALDATHRFNDDWSLRTALSWIKPKIEKLNLYPDALRADRRSLDRSLDFSRESQNDRAVQVELTGKFTTGSVRHTLLSGVEFYRNSFRYTFAPFDAAPPIDIYAPVYGQVVLQPGYQDAVAFGDDYGSRTTALYLQDQMAFGDHWKGVIGVRYDRSRLFDENLVDATLSLRPQTQSRLSPRVGVVYQPSTATSLFAGYSSSFNPQIFSPLANGDLPQPEIGKQLEVGWRQEWLQGALASTLSVFEIVKRNVTTADPANPNLSIQVGEQRSRGGELELRGRIAPGLDITGALALIDAKVTKDNTLPIGDRLDSAPRLSSSLWLKYQPAPRGWFGGGGVFHLGEREGTLPNNGVKLPAETRLDALLGYQADAWELQLNLRNLTDAKTYLPYGGLFIPGPGRNGELTARFTF